MPSRQVQFRSGQTVLAGDLISADVVVPAPAVVLLHGTGWGERRFYEAHAAEFAAAGLVSLIFDRRGQGESSGPPRMEVDVLAGDAVAAHGFLSRQPEVDPTRVGLWGYSNGAWVAARAAEQLRARLAFLVLTGAAGVSPARAEVYRRTEDLRSQGIAEPTLQAVERAWTLLFDCMATGAWDDAIERELHGLAAVINADSALDALQRVPSEENILPTTAVDHPSRLASWPGSRRGRRRLPPSRRLRPCSCRRRSERGLATTASRSSENLVCASRNLTISARPRVRLTVLLSEVICDSFGDVSECVELCGGEDVGEAVADRREMQPCGRVDRGEPLVGEHDIEAASIAVARCTAHGAALFHAGDLM